jgi:hypothetical protein
MVAQAHRRNAAAIAAGRLVLVEGGLERLGELPGPFDRVLAINVALFWPDQIGAFRAIRAVMSPGARIVVTHQPRRPGATAADSRKAAEELHAALTAAGFSRLETFVLEVGGVPAASVRAWNDA